MAALEKHKDELMKLKADFEKTKAEHASTMAYVARLDDELKRERKLSGEVMKMLGVDPGAGAAGGLIEAINALKEKADAGETSESKWQRHLAEFQELDTLSGKARELFGTEDFCHILTMLDILQKGPQSVEGRPSLVWVGNVANPSRMTHGASAAACPGPTCADIASGTDDGHDVMLSAAMPKKSGKQAVVTILEEPNEDLVRMVRAALVGGEAVDLDEAHNAMMEWDVNGTFSSEKLFGMLKAKVDSTLLHGSPHSVGAMWKYHTTVGRLTAVLTHYANLREAGEVTWQDVLGCLRHHPSAFCKGIRMSDVTGDPSLSEKIILLVKLNGQHTIAEDGGRIPAKKGGRGGK
jgi:hypothetical protein